MPDSPAHSAAGGWDGSRAQTGIQALLGPTNTGKTHKAVERMLSHASGIMGLPLRLLAREVYDRISARIGENAVALITGEEKRVPRKPRYWVCTVESMPLALDVDFVAVDEIQLVADRQRGHTFTDRLLHARGRLETWFLGSQTARSLIQELLPTAQIHRDPRMSRLSHSGVQSMGSLPPRTAVVAFSVEDVYEIAEHLRRRHGGTAVVLGALSPRTRNAQVAMYQSGEVQHLVATDAIGMGLNLDVDRVVFAALHKYDGRAVRAVEPAELAQIAGRAGRHLRDGTFGTLRPWHGAGFRLEELRPHVVAAIENHTFAPVRRAVWRNSDLDFSSIDTLIESLRQRPRMRRLQLVERSDDFEALSQLVRRDEVRRRAVGAEAVALLWDVCRIPDFRKLLLDSHVQLLGAVFAQLSGPTGRIDADWMARRIARLDDTDGDIETLMNRLAFIRTWTYISNHDRWVHDAEHWRALTRDIEDRQSDALHRRLTERFVERPGQGAGATRSSVGRKRRRSAAVSTVADNPDSPFHCLLELELPDAAREDFDTLEDAWVQSLVDAPFSAFEVDERGEIAFAGVAVATFRRGADIVHPQVVLLTKAPPMSGGERARVLRRLVAWSRDVIDELLEPLSRLDERMLQGAGRGLVYQLGKGLGTVDGRDAAAQVKSLSSVQRARLIDAGIVLGREGAYLPHGLRPGAIRLRAALWSVHAALPGEPPVPAAGRVSVPLAKEISRSFYPHVGYLVRGPMAVRVDQLERASAWLSSDVARDTPACPTLGAVLGCSRRRLPAVLAAMGYRLDEEGRAQPVGRTRRRARRARGRRSARARQHGGVGSAG